MTDNLWPIETRKKAAQRRVKKYWTGKPCKHGHISQRYVATGTCCRCNTVNVANSHKRARSKEIAELRGLTPVTVMVHPDDAQAIQDTATTLTFIRGLS